MMRLFKILAAAIVSIVMFPAVVCAAPLDANPLGALTWMTGKTWVADSKSADGKTTHIESTVSIAPNGKAITFVTTFNGKPEYNGLYAYDPEIKKIRFWYTSSEGEYSHGTVDSDGNALLLTLAITDPDGTTASLRSHIRSISATAYDWNVETQTNAGWTELVRLHYTAKAG